MFGSNLRSGKSAVIATALGFALLAVAAVLWWQHGAITSRASAGPLQGQRTAAIRTAELARLPARPDDLAAQTLQPFDRDAARKLNESTPFAELRPASARPFQFAGSQEDRARAVDCLALAAMAEAGGGDPDQRAVIQVVLNRVRHPAFAKTICGVVFQGSERTTGCQFTFTCDGSLARVYSEAAWAAARRRASEALNGSTFTPVGTATHYHTDWVHPVWSGELNKIARISTHLFFRWPGYWGSRDAARIAYRGGEPAIAKIAWLPSHAGAEGKGGDAPVVAFEPRRIGEKVGIGRVVASHPNGTAYLMHLTPRPNALAALSVGRDLCSGRSYCRVLGWTDRGAIPKGFPVPPGPREKLTFSYVLDGKSEYTFYDCGQFQGVPRDSCMPAPSPAPSPAAPVLAAAPAQTVQLSSAAR